ncbi:MAG: Citrate lyase subunit beta / citryl-CoA lyase [Hyphomicrobiales bacterium]|nr:Citrate lyase subunit beta / citryl-CoA lyase [Hyphomicrobiales bacterium]
MPALLFVPADSPRKIAKALGCGAATVILDLEDSVAPGAKERAREGAAEALRGRAPGGPRLVARVNGLDTGLIDADLDALVALAPDAIMLPKCEGGDDAQHLSVKLAVREAQCGAPDGAIGLLPIVTETAAAMFRLGSYRGATRRLRGLAWGAEDLAAAIGAQTNRSPDGAYTPPFALARNLTLFAASSAGVEAIDTVYADFRDPEGLRRECLAARRDGFCGKMAIHPDQVAIINEAFAPAPGEIARAQAIVAAFAQAPDSGALSLDGAMIDRPHLLWAQRVLARAKS